MSFFIGKVRTLKIKFFMLAIMFLSFYMFFSYILLEVSFVNNIIKTVSTVSVSLSYVVMHIDLKGTPLKLSYLESLLPLLKENGVNSLLMEYEDMFPYYGNLANLSAENCYGNQELKQFLSTAVSSGFEIIPLVQTFGHLEYALKLPEFQHLREEQLYPDSICPSRLESMALIRHMLEQIIDFHYAIRPLKYIHIGCDEIFHINKCQHCINRILTRADIFVHHVKTLSRVIKSQYAGTTVLIWDDMLRGINLNKWNSIDQFTNVQPVYWDYSNKLQVSHWNLFKYHQKFKHIWIASAFKGADGLTATFPNLRNRYENLYNWMSLITNYKFGGEKKVYNFKGVILTGWSRYTHMDPPCELLPVSIPSLILSLKMIQKFKSGFSNVSDSEFFNRYLSSDMVNSINCVVDIDNSFIDPKCNFDGRELYDILKTYNSIEWNGFLNNEEYIEFYSKFNLIPKNSIFEKLEMIRNRLKEINYLEKRLDRAMYKYYKEDFVAEYINYKIFLIKKKLQTLINIYDTFQNVSTWQRRSRNITYFTIT